MSFYFYCCYFYTSFLEDNNKLKEEDRTEMHLCSLVCTAGKEKEYRIYYKQNSLKYLKF